MEETAESTDPWAILGRLSVIACPACGADTNRSGDVCEACGAALEKIEDEAPLNVMAGQAARRIHKVPMEEAKNLIKLKKAREAVVNGTMTPEQLDEVIDDLLFLVESGLDVYQSPAIKAELPNMDPLAAKIYNYMAWGATEMQAGLVRVRNYLTTLDVADIDAGIAQVESGLWKIDEAQDIAVQQSEIEG